LPLKKKNECRGSRKPDRVGINKNKVSMITKIDNNGKVKFYNPQTGGLCGGISAIGKAVEASLNSNEEEVLILFENGDVKIYAVKSGGLKYSVANASEKVVRAVFQGDNVLLTFQNSKMQLRSKTGGIISNY
jgi:hypothetical protein